MRHAPSAAGCPQQGPDPRTTAPDEPDYGAAVLLQPARRGGTCTPPRRPSLTPISIRSTPPFPSAAVVSHNSWAPPPLGHSRAQTRRKAHAGGWARGGVHCGWHARKNLRVCVLHVAGQLLPLTMRRRNARRLQTVASLVASSKSFVA